MNGPFAASITIANAPTSAEPITIEMGWLRLTSPRIGGRGPEAGVEATGLPLTIAPAAEASLELTGSYSLVQTDEGGKANLHLSVNGRTSSGEPFSFGLNVLLRAPGVEP